MMPKCIIFDEATAMLDPAGRSEVMQHYTDAEQRSRNHSYSYYA